MTKIQNSKSVWVIEYWNLRFICNLVLGIWNLCPMKQSFEYPTKEKGVANPCPFLETY
jgi:hypothetical protein